MVFEGKAYYGRSYLIDYGLFDYGYNCGKLDYCDTFGGFGIGVDYCRRYMFITMDNVLTISLPYTFIDYLGDCLDVVEGDYHYTRVLTTGDSYTTFQGHCNMKGDLVLEMEDGCYYDALRDLGYVGVRTPTLRNRTLVFVEDERDVGYYCFFVTRLDSGVIRLIGRYCIRYLDFVYYRCEYMDCVYRDDDYMDDLIEGRLTICFPAGGLDIYDEDYNRNMFLLVDGLLDYTYYDLTIGDYYTLVKDVGDSRGTYYESGLALFGCVITDYTCEVTYMTIFTTDYFLDVGTYFSFTGVIILVGEDLLLDGSCGVAVYTVEAYYWANYGTDYDGDVIYCSVYVIIEVRVFVLNLYFTTCTTMIGFTQGYTN